MRQSMLASLFNKTLIFRNKISVVDNGKEHVNKQINIISYSLVEALKEEIKQKQFGMVCF
jgi:hypothetical protein